MVTDERASEAEVGGSSATEVETDKQSDILSQTLPLWLWTGLNCGDLD